jgi:hypothetical protein
LAVCALYGAGKVATKLEMAANTRGAEERQLVDNLLLWVAREIGANYQRQPAEKSDPAKLQERADLGLVAMSAAAHPKLESWAEYRDPWLSIWDDSLKVPLDWTSRQMAYGSILQRFRGTALSVGTKAPQSGDLVQWVGERDLPWVVASVKGHKAALLEPAGRRGAEKKVLLTSVGVLDIDTLTLDVSQEVA